ncbi:MAG: DUF2628 domain-containing protein [Ruminococcaceae bacterium]|nr:DUF2628 domain-containing protein [Oscillospiraceae bacterium]
MDYIGKKCPVCDKYFHAYDDIVVCPECGTPSHRECYQSIGKCINADKHAQGYDYQKDMKSSFSDDETGTVCKKCGTKNPENAFFCNKCGSTLNEPQFNSTQNVYGQPYQQTQNNQTPNNTQFPQGANVIMFDPLAGVSPNTDLGDGVTVGETAKFVKQSTPYFITVFNNIKNFSKSRFNFCAMFFSGGYLLFRKMYKIGAFITAIQAAMIILDLYLSYFINSSSVYSKFFEALYSYDSNAAMLHLSQLPQKELSMLGLYYAISALMLIMSIVIGACANRMYFNHCKKQIIKIKNETDDPTKLDEALRKKGSVNFPLAISLWITYLVISYLPLLFY